MHKMKQGEHLQTYFFQRKKALNEEKKVVSTLAGRYFGSPWLGHIIIKKINKKNA